MDPIRTTGGFADLVGYELSVWREDHAELVLEVEAKHLNRSGVMHGGVLTTLIDTVCGYAGTYTPEADKARRALTLSLTTQFIGAVSAGAQITAVGRRTGGGRQIYFSSAEVHDQDGRVIGRGDGVFKYRRDDTEPTGGPS